MSNILKTRVPNFTNSERLHMVQLIADKYAGILEDKKTDRTSVVQKQNAWQQIEVDFNASSSSSVHRSASCLRNESCYENSKKQLRKTLANEKRQVNMTGGGPVPKIKKDNTEEILVSIINGKTLVGLLNKFDDDEDDGPITEFRMDGAVELILDNENVENEVTVPTLNPHKYTSLFQNSPNPALTYDDSSSKHGPSEASEPNRIKSTRKRVSRRRPTTLVKTLTSSDVAKKYNLLLDKRLSLIEGQLRNMEEEHALVVRKRNLEIEMLELELRTKKANLGSGFNCL